MKTVVITLLLITSSVYSSVPRMDDGKTFKIHKTNRTTKSKDSTQLKSELQDHHKPTTGSLKVMVILAEYSDRSFKNKYDVDFYTDMFDEVNEYYSDQSYGELDLDAEIIGPVAIGEEYKYAGDRNGDIDGNTSYNACIDSYRMTIQNLDIDYDSFNHNGNNSPDHVVVIVPSDNQAASADADPDTSVWPVYWTTVVDFLDYRTGFMDNVKQTWTTTSRMSNCLVVTQDTPLGVVVHELGHSFGLPDLYDYSGSTKGIGKWGVMASGSWAGKSKPGDRPSPFIGWSKLQLGWIGTDRIATEPQGSANPVEGNEGGISHYQVQIGGLDDESSSANIYTVGATQNNGDYFLVEYRDSESYWEKATINQSGFLIWHIDETMDHYGGTQFRRIDLEEASLKQNLESYDDTNRGNAADLWSDGDYFGSDTSPSTYFHPYYDEYDGSNQQFPYPSHYGFNNFDVVNATFDQINELNYNGEVPTDTPSQTYTDAYKGPVCRNDGCGRTSCGYSNGVSSTLIPLIIPGFLLGFRRRKKR